MVQTYDVVVPRNSAERRKLKEGFVEDENDFAAYMDFRLVIPSCCIAAASLLFVVLAMISSYFSDEQRLDDEALTSWLNITNWYDEHCNVSILCNWQMSGRRNLERKGRKNSSVTCN